MAANKLELSIVSARNTDLNSWRQRSSKNVECKEGGSVTVLLVHYNSSWQPPRLSWHSDGKDRRSSGCSHNNGGSYSRISRRVKATEEKAATAVVLNEANRLGSN